MLRGGRLRALAARNRGHGGSRRFILGIVFRAAILLILIGPERHRSRGQRMTKCIPADIKHGFRHPKGFPRLPVRVVGELAAAMDGTGRTVAVHLCEADWKREFRDYIFVLSPAAARQLAAQLEQALDAPSRKGGPRDAPREACVCRAEPLAGATRPDRLTATNAEPAGVRS